MRVAALINPNAGTVAAAGGSDAFSTRLSDLFAASGLVAEVRPVLACDMAKAARNAQREGVDAVVAVGGDGTINTVAGSLVHTDTALAVLPLGTHNHFAKDLGIPLDLAKAVECVARNHARRIDVGEVNGHFFLNNASLGAYPLIVRERESLQQWLPRPKWLATCLAAIRVLGRHPGTHVTLQLGDKIFRRRTPFVFVGNNRYELNLLRMNLRTCLDRGELSIYTAQCRNRFGVYRLLWLAAFQKLEQADELETFCAKEFKIQKVRRWMRVALDGEVFKLRSPLQFRSQALSLKVIAPPPADCPP